MMDERDVELSAYQNEADLARARIGITIDRIQAKVAPARLVAEASDAVKLEIAGGVDSARRSMQRHPIAIGAAGAALGLLAIRHLTK